MQQSEVVHDTEQAAIVARQLSELYGGSSGSEAVRILRSYVDHQGSVDVVMAEPGASPPMHFHKYDETFQVFEGNMTFSLDGKVIEATTGTSVIVPAGTYHTWINRSDGPVSMRVIVPAGATFLAMLHDPAARVRAEFCNDAADRGVLVVGPPLIA